MSVAKAFFADILSFDDNAGPGHQASLMRDALMLVVDGKIAAIGPAAQLKDQMPAHTEKVILTGKTLAPGFVDIHLHYPQLDVIASPADGLLPWLDNHTFPQETRFADNTHAANVSELFLDEMLRNGMTTGLVFCTSHPGSVDAFFTAAQRRGLRMVAGKVLMDRNAPEGLRDETEQSLIDSEQLIQRWHQKDRLGYALTPRFAPTCSDEQMRGAGLLASRYDGVWIQTHVAENLDEIAWVKQLYPKARSYLDVYEGFGLMRERSIYAHCIHLDAADRQRMKELGAAAAVCPTSNLFLGSGLFDFEQADAAGFEYGFASDVGGGSSFSPFRTMFTGYEVARLRGKTLSPSELWYRHTLGASRAMGLGTQVGNLKPGFEADFVVLDAQSTPLLARRSSLAASLDEWMFSLIVLGDDRAIAQTYALGVPVKN